LSRIEAGFLQPAYLPFRPKYLVAKWGDQIGILAQQKNIALSVNLSPDVPAVLLGDEDAIGKIVINLLLNAVKFTPPNGAVSLTITPTADRQSIQYIVSDTGIGIPPDAHDYIYDAFRQVDQSSTREYGGTGLGLTIVKKLTDAMSGTIHLHSVVNEGTTFTITFPLNTPLVD
ncbi:MAG: hypothetical protein KJ043_13165, partial [Anaerolineae bacterium]|nr:hypothetical protein [Anaerolineae bacterium]